MNVDIADPRKLAAYLTVALNQRRRQLTNFNQTYGQGSAPSVAAEAEIEEIQAYTSAALKAAATAPLTKTR